MVCMRSSRCFLLISLLSSTALLAQQQAYAQADIFDRGGSRIVSTSNPYQERRNALERQKNFSLQKKAPASHEPAIPKMATRVASRPLRVPVPNLPVEHPLDVARSNLPVRILEVQLNAPHPPRIMDDSDAPSSAPGHETASAVVGLTAVAAKEVPPPAPPTPAFTAQKTAPPQEELAAAETVASDVSKPIPSLSAMQTRISAMLAANSTRLPEPEETPAIPQPETERPEVLEAKAKPIEETAPESIFTQKESAKIAPTVPALPQPDAREAIQPANSPKEATIAEAEPEPVRQPSEAVEAQEKATLHEIASLMETTAAMTPYRASATAPDAAKKHVSRPPVKPTEHVTTAAVAAAEASPPPTPAVTGEKTPPVMTAAAAPETPAPAASSQKIVPLPWLVADASKQASPDATLPAAEAEVPTATKQTPDASSPSSAEAPPSSESQVAETAAERMEPTMQIAAKVEKVDVINPVAPQAAAVPETFAKAEPAAPPANIISSPDPLFVVKRSSQNGESNTEITSTPPAALAALTPAAGGEAMPLPVPAITPPPVPATAQAAPAVAIPETSEPAPALSGESRKILARVPSRIDSPPAHEKGRKVKINRQHQLEDVFNPDDTDKPRTHEALGIKIDVRQPKLNSNYELEKAYNALLSGQSPTAIDIYRNILAQEPNNTQAMFGLATAYQRAGQLEKARPLYGEILKIDPDNAAALNNFLMLAADEAPDDALQQLQALEQRNPDFSPIPAQLAVLYQKRGQLPEATDAMLRAVALSPENLTYRYNLAVLFDRQKKRAEAADLYKQLVDAHLKGEKIPNIQQIQERLTFLRSNH